MKRFYSLFLLLSFVNSCASTKLISEIVSFYKTILTHHGKTNVDVDGLKLLMNTFHDDSSRCFESCQAYLEKLVGKSGVPWNIFEQIAYSLYPNISDDPFEPQELHLSLCSDPSSMNVMFVTMENLIDPFAEYMVFYDSGNDAPKWEQGNTSRAAAQNSTYEVPQKWWPVFSGVIYQAELVNLAAETIYQYRVGGYDVSNQTIRYSDTFTFKSPPTQQNPDRKTVVSALADHGTFMLFGFLTVDKLIQYRQNIDLDFVFVAGDLSYAGLFASFPPLNITEDDEFEHVWDLYGIQNEPIAATVPWMIGVGNHESFYNWTAVSSRYKMPTSSQSYGNFWYDFDYANIHWISISSEHDLSDGSPQKSFLLASLEKAVMNRDMVPWIIVTLHKPLYCSDEGTPTGFASLLESTFLQYDVDLVVTGHLHVYERIHPVKGGIVTVFPTKCQINSTAVDIYFSDGLGPVYVVQGNTGAMQSERWIQPQPAWSAIRFANGILTPNISSVSMDPSSDNSYSENSYDYKNTFGFGIITVWNSTHMQYEAQADTESNLGTDTFWIAKRV